jgi:hypothetical protein
MIKYLVNGTLEEISNRLGKLVARDRHAESAVIDASFASQELENESFSSLAALSKDDTSRYRAEAEFMLTAAKSQESTGIYKLIIGADDFEVSPGKLAFLALDEKVLEVATAYLGGRPLLHGMRLLLSEPTGNLEVERDQLWHRDRYDEQTLRLFVYLDDCGLQQGPFRYLPRNLSDGVWRTYISRVTDAYLERRGDLQGCVEVVGNAGDRFLADVRRLVHCGSRISSGRRLVFNAIYTTATPWKPAQISEAVVSDFLKQPLSQLQRSALLRG